MLTTSEKKQKMFDEAWLDGQKFQKGFKTLPSAHPDEAFVQPALHPAQWLHHAPAREGHQAAKALEVQHVWLHLQD